MSYVRHCPRCKTDRELTETVCQGEFRGEPCNWSLFGVERRMAGGVARPEPPEADVEGANPPAPAVEAGQCVNGHPLEPGDFLCLECGEPAVQVGSCTERESEAGVQPTSRLVNGWRLGAELAVVSGESDLFLATLENPNQGTVGEVGVFKHYRRGIEPDTSLYSALRALDPDHGLRLLDFGRYEERAFEVWEHVPLGTLGAIPPADKADPNFVRQAVLEIGGALQGLADVQIIHRDLKPANVLVRSREPFDLVLADFSTASVSEFDLQLTVSRQTTRYAAPETIVGTCSPASDWWSLGVMVLEMLCQGRGFEGVHERAFLLHLITRGLRVPEDLPEEWRELLMGLLTRDPSKRWAWPQVQRWLGGERGIPHGYSDSEDGAAGLGRSLRLGTRDWPTPESFAMAAAESAVWEDACALLEGGRIATWLQERGGERDVSRAAQLRVVTGDRNLSEDQRLAVALLILNENLPLCLRGEIVTPAWVLSHPEVAHNWLASSLPSHLGRLKREPWLVRLHERANRVRARIRENQIVCDEAQLSAALLVTSQSMLEKRWHDRRRLYPEADHPALSTALERRNPTEEDLILLVSATIDSFRLAEDVLTEAESEASHADVGLSREEAQKWFELSRRQVLDVLNERLAHFVRCGCETANQWADDFRQTRRITLARTLVLLSIPEGEWCEPPQQEYVRNVLTFFQRRVVNGMQRGGLIRMTIGKTTARLDLTELGGPSRSAEALLSSVLNRQGKLVAIDPDALLNEPQREHRLRRLYQNATAYRKDTGISALFLGFPFVVLRDSRASAETKPRIAPVLLWPVILEIPTGTRATVRLGFDADRGEVRINPALEGLLGTAAPQWRDLLDDLRERDHVDLQSTMDLLGSLASIDTDDVGTVASLKRLPPATASVSSREVQLHAAAVLFLSDFSGQTIAEDLKQLAMRPIEDTALEVAIRASAGRVQEESAHLPPEVDRYFTTAADPSQQTAVFRARQKPGLVVQGPPGTGKSQTIVNIVCDAIGRGEKVLIVCQKKAALEVVCKRLESEGLGDRLFLLNDPVADRKTALLKLREQLEQPTRTPAEDGRIRRERESCARQVEAIEKELNDAHAASYDTGSELPSNMPYLEVLDELLRLERGNQAPVKVAALQSILRPLDEATVEELTAQIATVAVTWLEARYEQSPLKCLAQFQTDEGSLATFNRSFDLLRAAERRREELLCGQLTRFFKIETPTPLHTWLTENETPLRSLPAEVVEVLCSKSELLKPADDGQPSLAEHWVSTLEQIEEKLQTLDSWVIDKKVLEKLATRGTGPLRELAGDAAWLSVKPRSFLAGLNPKRWFTRRRLNVWLRDAGADPEATDLVTLHAAAALELEMREEKATLNQWRTSIGDVVGGSTESLSSLRAAVLGLLERLRPLVAIAQRVHICPVEPAREEMWSARNPEGLAAVLDTCRRSLKMLAATQESLLQLEAASEWFDSSWLATRRFAQLNQIRGDDSLAAIASAIPSLPAFQEFRMRAKDFSPEGYNIFACLREYEDTWRRISPTDLPKEISRTMRREALLAWKNAAETVCPALCLTRDEHEAKVQILKEKDAAMREENRRLLSQCSANVEIGSRRDWDDVVMLTGIRARRLREVVDRGSRLGLFSLRPIWMMNPEMVSRLFPLQARIFDLLVFDEASQLPVECALPAMFRARRIVVSGDEKQMPPSRFFGYSLDTDEDDGGEQYLEADDARLDDGERERLRQAAGRRELKDCPDLLTLTQQILPTETLKIHYRSRYRHLINFSNAAFYGDKLSVPARHPESLVLEARPLELDRVDGAYSAQTNDLEAERVVERLRELWLQPAAERPSIGVVTFNLKQSDLIQDKLEALAEEDDDFRRALETERDRTQNNEDMGFFVKNLENVQGDERDVIIFSTTFGRDSAGTFRRNFGVLGQQGGERRLNVAITRAREKVILITSLPVGEISSWLGNQRRYPPTIPRDFIQAWLAYVERLDAGEFKSANDLLQALTGNSTRATRLTANSPTRSSIFQGEVGEYLRTLGHEPVPSLGDAFGVDFAVTDPRTGHFGIGIECNTPYHAILDTARARELWRPSVMSASLPSLHRVSARAWYADRTEEEIRLKTAVDLALNV